MRALQEDDTTDWPNDRLREGCLELFARENAKGTELPAIVGALQEHVEAEEQRLITEHRELVRAAEEAKRRELADGFLAGADCKWTSVERSETPFCRMNGRAYRLTPSPD